VVLAASSAIDHALITTPMPNAFTPIVMCA